jgi:hypothetical protein
VGKGEGREKKGEKGRMRGDILQFDEVVPVLL